MTSQHEFRMGVATLEEINPAAAEELCRQIILDLPEYFGLPECNEHYAVGVRSRKNMAIKIEEQYVGLLSLEFPYPNNGNIYWMGVLRAYQQRGIGRLLIEAAVKLAKEQNARTLTVETLCPTEADENYLKTYHFYRSCGFGPLFNLKHHGYVWNMVYMAMDLNRAPNHTHTQRIEIRSLTESDISVIVQAFEKHDWAKPRSTFETYLLEQQSGVRPVWVAQFNGKFAGYVTLAWESKYKPFYTAGLPEIMDLNVLPPFRNCGVGSKLLQTAEAEAQTRSSIVGIGVGLYDGYGAAQKLYIKRGYIPDGLGVTYDYQPVSPGGDTVLDDDLVLWFTKQL